MAAQNKNNARSKTREVDGPFLKRLKGEVAHWRSVDMISPEQARGIVGLYVVEAGAPAARGRLVTALGLLGSILVGVGVIMFFAANWDGLDRGFKIGLVSAAILSAYGAGYWLSYVRDQRRIGLSLIFLGTLLYGAAIHLIAQAYHFPVDDPDLMLYWFAGVIPLAYATRSQPVTALALLLFLSALGFRLQDFLGKGPDSEATLIAAFAIFGVTGLMLNGLGKLHALWARTRSFANTYQVIGLMTALAALYLLSFRDLYGPFSFGQAEISLDNISASYWVAMSISGLLVLVGAVPAALRLIRHRQRDAATMIEAVGATALLIPLILVVALPGGGEFGYSLAFNLIFLMVVLAILITGYLRGREAFINLGLAFFSIDVITRYFEFGWDLLDRSLVFVVAGAILLVGGYLLERGRRGMIGRIQAGGNRA